MKVKKGAKIITITDNKEWTVQNEKSYYKDFDFVASYKNDESKHISVGGTGWFRFEDEGIVWDYIE